MQHGPTNTLKRQIEGIAGRTVEISKQLNMDHFAYRMPHVVIGKTIYPLIDYKTLGAQWMKKKRL